MRVLFVGKSKAHNRTTSSLVQACHGAQVPSAPYLRSNAKVEFVEADASSVVLVLRFRRYFHETIPDPILSAAQMYLVSFVASDVPSPDSASLPSLLLELQGLALVDLFTVLVLWSNPKCIFVSKNFCFVFA